jgi:5,10-methylenetetrahydromethanopterin reductase
MAEMVQDLSAYVLPGKSTDARLGISQAVVAERIGLGGIWASERWAIKESGAVLGAIAHATSRIGIRTGTTHFGTRHPLVLAGMATTLQNLSGGRFEMGVARSLTDKWRRLGVLPQTNQSMIDSVGILRRLWAGETVSYSGPAGEFPELVVTDMCEWSTPVHLAAVGPKTLAIAGAHFDGVLLHPFLTPAGVARSAAVVREAARAAGRDPADVRVIAAVVVAPDLTEDQTRLAIHTRAATYFVHRAMVLPIVEANGWDVAQLDAITSVGLETLETGNASQALVRAKMLEASALIPPEWISEGASAGTAAEVAARLQDYRAAGADEILLHGATPDKLEGLVDAYRGLNRPAVGAMAGVA